jgi:hypothetical protein
MAFYTNENLKANSPRSNGDTLQIHQQLSPEDYQMQRLLNERADYKRYASLNTPTYGMWNGESFESTDPNRIAEINANAEMRRTGLDRYYHPNSAAYYAAFQGIRDKYLQQEMAKKAAIENEGKQLYSNRMGAFDKLIQDKYGLQKEKIESAGLEGLRRSQAKQAEAIAKSYDSDGMTPKERVADKKNTVTNILKQGDDMRAAIKEMIANAPTEHDRQVFTRSLGKLQGWINSDINAVNKGEAPTGLAEFSKWLSNTGSYTPRPIDAQPTQIQPPKAEGVKLTPEEIELAKQGQGAIVRNKKTGAVEYKPNSTQPDTPLPKKIQTQEQTESITPELAAAQKKWDRYNRESLGLRGLFLRGPVESKRAEDASRAYWAKQNNIARLAEIERIRRQEENRKEIGLE